jgi:hypothetical protein
VALVVEHGSSRGGRWLRRNRLRLALWIAVLEGLLVLVDVIPTWTAIAVAVGLVLFYVIVGRNVPSDTVRQVSWIGAVSQLLVATLPILIALLTMVAIIVLVIIAAVALALLFLDRR